MSAGIAEREEPLGALSHHHALLVHNGQEHLSIRKFALIAYGTVPSGKRSLFEFSRSSVAMVHSNLVAIDQSSAHPAGNGKHYSSQNQQRHGHAIWFVQGRSLTVGNVGVEQKSSHVDGTVQQPST